MQNPELFINNALALHTFFRGSFLEAYAGLYRVKQQMGEIPEDCVYVKLAKRQFLESGEADKLIELINNLHGSINHEETE